MVIDPASIAQGVVSGIATQKAIVAADKALGKITGSEDNPSPQDLIVMLLAELVNIQRPQEKFNVDMPMLIQPSPYYYQIDENWLGRSHFCIFFPAVTSVSILTEGAGTVTKNSIAGWMQIDLRGQLMSGDANSHPVIVSYRNDALGASF